MPHLAKHIPSALTLTLLVFLSFSRARADTVVIHFDELPPQVANGVSLMGVTFGFTISGSPSSDATFNHGGPGIMTFVQCPCLEGNGAGTLTMNFAAPSTILSFGLARSSIGGVNPGGRLQLFDAASNSLGIFDIPTFAPPSPFAEGFFNYSGVPFSRAVLTFQVSFFRFAVDNLTFNTPAAVPEPTTLLLFATGVTGALGVARWRRRVRNDNPSL
jgi:hypothetical protein